MKQMRFSPRAYPAALGLYLLCALFCTGVTLGCARLRTLPGWGGLLAAVCMAALIAALLWGNRALGGPRLAEGPFVTKYLTLALILPAFNLAMSVSPLNRAVSFPAGALWLISLLAAVVLEELLFRLAALLLFRRRGLFSPKGAIAVSLIFGLYQLAVCHTLPLTDALLQALLAACGGLFLTALYLRTKNLFVPIAAHFLMDFSMEFFCLFSASPEVLGPDWLIIAIYSLLLLTVGCILLIRGRRAEPKEPSE